MLIYLSKDTELLKVSRVINIPSSSGSGPWGSRSMLGNGICQRNSSGVNPSPVRGRGPFLPTISWVSNVNLESKCNNVKTEGVVPDRYHHLWPAGGMPQAPRHSSANITLRFFVLGNSEGPSSRVAGATDWRDGGRSTSLPSVVVGLTNSTLADTCTAPESTSIGSTSGSGPTGVSFGGM